MLRNRNGRAGRRSRVLPDLTSVASAVSGAPSDHGATALHCGRGVVIRTGVLDAARESFLHCPAVQSAVTERRDHLRRCQPRLLLGRTRS